MISFRYHIFTIVAIFLAVGLGLLVGTSVVQPALINDLRRQANQLTRDLSDTRAEVSDLKAQVGALQQAGDILRAVDPGTLSGVPVVIVTHDGVDARLLTQARQSLSEAKAKLVAVLSFTHRMVATDDPTRRALAEILGVAGAPEPSTLQQRAALVLAQRLAAGERHDQQTQPPTPDVLDALLTANFLTTPSGTPAISKADLPGIGGKGQAVVVLSGGQGEPSVPPQQLFVPLVDGLAGRGAVVAAGESVTTDYPFVSALRSDAAPGTQMVTVDDLDFSVGGAALVLGLERLMFLGQGGNYGIKSGASAALPSVT